MVKVEINPKFESLRKEIEKIPDTIAVCGDKIFQGRNRIYRSTMSGVDLTVKEFRVPSALNRIVYSTVRRSKACRSYLNAMHLQSLGIDTPEPIAYIEEHCHGMLRRSYYVCRYIEGDTIRQWETRIADSDKMLDALGQFTLTLHRNGVLHKDFSPGNIIYRRDADGAFHFALVDINRMEFGVHSKKRLYRNFRSINIESEEQTLRFAEAYARAAGIDPAAMRDIARCKLHAYYREKALHRRLKSLIRKK